LASDYEILRQRLDQQLLTDLQRVYAAYLTQVRACDTLAASQVGTEAGRLPPLSPSAALAGALTGALGPGEITVVLAPAHAPALPAAPAQPAPPPPPARRRRPKTGDFEVHDAVVAALDEMPEVFDKNDLLRHLPMKPTRGTLFRVLDDLEHQNVIALAERGSGSTPSRYRKAAPAEPPAAD
jgi:hypothetical protein